MRQDRLVAPDGPGTGNRPHPGAYRRRQARAQMRREEGADPVGGPAAGPGTAGGRRGDRVAWVRGHVLDLLFVPVIVVPAVLAWIAMGAYGYQLYGPPGLLLPAFSEGAMWAFAIATTGTIRRHPGPARLASAARHVGVRRGRAALNFTHGVTGPGTHGAGWAW